MDILPSPPPLSPRPPRRQSRLSPSRKPRKPGPSRLRRHARQEEARRAASEAAENAANVVTSNEAENATASDPAVQAEQLPPHENLCVAAEQSGQSSSVAAEQVLHQQVKLNVDARPWPHGDGHVRDIFCPDHQYLQHQKLHLPQAPRNQCDVCGKTFGSERALSNHMDRDHK